MSVRATARDRAIGALASRGFEIRRHVAARRQQMLADHGIRLVVDVGAAKGAYGRQLREFGYQGNIVSFEPLRDAFGVLRRVSADDGKWLAVNVALGSQSGSAEINVASNSDSSSLLPMRQEHLMAAPTVEYVDIETVTLRRLDDELQGLPDYDADGCSTFLKIDAQGFERHVLGGASESLPAIRGLQLELSFVPLYEGGWLVNDAMTWAYELGFHLVGVEPGFTGTGGDYLQGDGVFFR